LLDIYKLNHDARIHKLKKLLISSKSLLSTTNTDLYKCNASVTEVSTCHSPSTSNFTLHTRKLHHSPYTYLWCTVVWIKVETVVVVGECLLAVGGECTADEGLCCSERCPLPTANSFASAVVLKAEWSRRSMSEDDTFGCCSCLHLALEVSFLLRRFDGFLVSGLSCPRRAPNLL